MDFERTVSVYIVNNKKQVLLLKHKKTGDWAMLGGHVEEGELTHQAVIRESLEEAGMEIDFVYDYGKIPERIEETRAITLKVQMVPHPLFVEYDYFKDHYHEHFVYLAKAKNDEIINNEEHEIGWFYYQETLALEMFEQVKLQLEYIKETTELL